MKQKTEKPIKTSWDSALYRLNIAGVESLSAKELVQLVLQEDYPQVANSVLKSASNIQALISMGPIELRDRCGLTTRQVAGFRAAIELGRRIWAEQRANGEVVSGPDMVYKVLNGDLKECPVEKFYVLCLNNSNFCIEKHMIAQGSVSAMVVHPREIFNVAVRCRASAVILAHNHPAGDPKPSNEDRQVTARIVEAGEILGIPVLDHVVVGDGRYVSFKEEGYITKKPE